MTKKDERIFEEMGLPQATIATLLGVERQAVHRGIKNENIDYFSLDRLATLHRNAHKTLIIPDDPWKNDYYQKRIEKLYLEESAAKSGRSLRDLHEAIGNLLAFCPQGVGAWIWLQVPSTPDALVEMLRPNGLFRDLVIGVDPLLTDAAIQALETWALGREGNFADRLQVHVVALANPPSATMLGGFKDVEFRGFIDAGEGFIPMTHPALADLDQQLAALASMDLAPGDVLRWSLPVTPEARILEVLLNDLGEDLPSTARDALRAEQQAFERESMHEEKGESAWNRVAQALSRETLRDSAGKEAILQARYALEAARLARV